VLHDLLGLDVAVRRGVLRLRSRQVCVHRPRGHEQVVRRFDRLDGLADDTRQVTRDVDGGVPASSAQRLEAAVAIPAQLLDAGEEVGIRLPPVEERQLVASRERRLDDRPAEELRAAEDQNSQSASSSRSTSPAVL
jgi:hypothetical protein